MSDNELKTLEDVIEVYKDVEFRFHSYYRYLIIFKGLSPEGKELAVYVGKNACEPIESLELIRNGTPRFNSDTVFKFDKVSNDGDLMMYGDNQEIMLPNCVAIKEKQKLLNSDSLMFCWEKGAAGWGP